MKTINIGISFTWRVEELNILLEILKLNFKNKYHISVFCNLDDESWRIIEPHIEIGLIDNLDRITDIKCNKRNLDKQDCKRRQPLDLFMGSIMELESHKENFIYTEGDVFPLDEKSYVSNIETEFLSVRKAEVVNPKVPQGYISPSPMYISTQAAQDIVESIINNRKMYLAHGYAFEGMLGHVISKFNKENIDTFSNAFHSNHDACRNLEPVSKTTHQHNPFNLKKEFEKRGINKGKWITKVLTEDIIRRVWNGELLELDEKFSLQEMPQ